jgi:hypothetical protein
LLDRGEIALFLFVHEATEDRQQQAKRSLRPQLYSHDEVRTGLRTSSDHPGMSSTTCTDLTREPEWNPKAKRVQKLSAGTIGL